MAEVNYKTEREFARDSLIKCANPKKTICETLRLIYDEVYKMRKDERRDKITELLVDATMMAKRMNERLRYYRKTYNDESGKNASNIGDLPGELERRNLRRRRKLYD